MAPRIGPKAPLESRLCWGTECHADHTTLVLILFATILVTWLEAAKLTVGFHAPWNISYPFSVQRLGQASRLPWTRSVQSQWDLETSPGSSLLPAWSVASRSLLLISSTRSRKNRFLPCLGQHAQKQQRYSIQPFKKWQLSFHWKRES